MHFSVTRWLAGLTLVVSMAGLLPVPAAADAVDHARTLLDTRSMGERTRQIRRAYLQALNEHLTTRPTFYQRESARVRDRLRVAVEVAEALLEDAASYDHYQQDQELTRETLASMIEARLHPEQLFELALRIGAQREAKQLLAIWEKWPESRDEDVFFASLRLYEQQRGTAAAVRRLGQAARKWNFDRDRWLLTRAARFLARRGEPDLAARVHEQLARREDRSDRRAERLIETASAAAGAGYYDLASELLSAIDWRQADEHQRGEFRRLELALEMGPAPMAEGRPQNPDRRVAPGPPDRSPHREALAPILLATDHDEQRELVNAYLPERGVAGLEAMIKELDRRGRSYHMVHLIERAVRADESRHEAYLPHLKEAAGRHLLLADLLADLDEDAAAEVLRRNLASAWMSPSVPQQALFLVGQREIEDLYTTVLAYTAYKRHHGRYNFLIPLARAVMKSEDATVREKFERLIRVQVAREREERAGDHGHGKSLDELARAAIILGMGDGVPMLWGDVNNRRIHSWLEPEEALEFLRAHADLPEDAEAARDLLETPGVKWVQGQDGRLIPIQ